MRVRLRRGDFSGRGGGRGRGTGALSVLVFEEEGGTGEVGEGGQLPYDEVRLGPEWRGSGAQSGRAPNFIDVSRSSIIGRGRSLRTTEFESRERGR